MRFAPEGWPFVIPWLGLALLLLALAHPRWATVCLLGGLATLLFFRDPTRTFEGTSDIVLAAADGKVLRIDEVEAEFADGSNMSRIVTFLSVFDVHVQRCPVAGEVVETRFQPGAKVAAFRPEAGDVNEQQLTVIRSPSGALFGVVQIAGLLARRVVGYLEEGDRVARGEHLGLIKFGSRVDLLVPAGYIIEVSPGDRVRAGQTPMARPDTMARPDK